ncbi:MAG: TOBE-like domain-containing protein, partial [Acidobacteriota bacterium]
VIVACEPPRAISAQNVLAATITEIRPSTGICLLLAKLADDIPTLSIELTPNTLERLDLAEGKTVHLIFKATGIVVYGGEGTPTNANTKTPTSVTAST